MYMRLSNEHFDENPRWPPSKNIIFGYFLALDSINSLSYSNDNERDFLLRLVILLKLKSKIIHQNPIWPPWTILDS